MHDLDTSRENLDRATEAALHGHSVATVTLVVLVRNGNQLVTHQQDCRPADRGAVLARLGINFSQPLRSPRYAFAWVDANCALQVGGTSERGKARLREMYDTIVMSREDLVLF